MVEANALAVHVLAFLRFDLKVTSVSGQRDYRLVRGDFMFRYEIEFPLFALKLQSFNVGLIVLIYELRSAALTRQQNAKHQQTEKSSTIHGLSGTFTLQSCSKNMHGRLYGSDRGPPNG
ncbi:UNVERIFIED_CONTAM: hypothetical protein K2H54_019785 [Gekko kuhli]